jgi:4-amino-4-deoxy-L-arabinose transferase-like glycosyltransferase
MVVVNLASKNNLLGLILLISFFLRLWQFDQYPAMGETIDEYAYTWLGQSILSGEPPASWSWFDHYEDVEMMTMAGQTFRLVKPWFDTPPLFSIIPGVMVKAWGAEKIQLPSIRVVRFPMIILGVLNVLLCYLVARALFSEKVGLMAAALYATIPTAVYGSRMVVTENLLITWLLLSILVLLHYLEKPKSMYLLILGILGGLSLLTKLTGVLVPATIVIWLIKDKRLGDALHVLITSVLVGSLWLIMGWKYGMDIFIQSFLAQSGLTIGFGSSLNLFLRPNIVDSLLADGWLTAGMVRYLG